MNNICSCCRPLAVLRISQRLASSVNIFDRSAKRIHREVSAGLSDRSTYEYLKSEVGWRIFDRICDIKRFFPVVLDLTPGNGFVAKHLLDDIAGIVLQTDLSQKAVAQAETPLDIASDKLILDDEQITIRDETVDLVASSLGMHWVNDLPRAFSRIMNCLRHDGAFIGAMLGGDTLFELRVALQTAELDKSSGIAPHISPFVTPQDVGALLNDAGFTLITIDIDHIVVKYPSLNELLIDLRRMAENNCSFNRGLHLRRSVLKAASEVYASKFGDEKGIPASFELIFWIGWRPDPSQARPAPRGSGTISIKDIDKLNHLFPK